MRASPAFQVSLQRYGVWRGAVLLLAASGAAVIVAWLLMRAPSASMGLVVAAAGVGASIVWLTTSLSRLPAVSLRWDGQLWHLGGSSSASDDSVPGDLRVVIDLGLWMLLRFTPATPGSAPPLTWLPVQRRGIETQWHALRCAVYSPRPVPGADAAVEL